MKKNGFTLIELLGVLVVLGIVALITFPIVRDNMKQGRSKLYSIQINNIKSSLKVWAGNNMFILPENEGETLKITIDQLRQSGDIDLNIKNSNTETLFPGDMELEIKRVGNSYVYNVLEETGTPTDEIEYNLDTPVIELKGATFMYVEDDFIDPGYKAYDKDNNPLTPTITIKKDGEIVNSIDTEESGTYYIYYKVTSDNLSSTVIRTVIVYESNKVKEGPTLDLTTQYSSANVEQEGLIGVAYLDPTDLSKTCDASNAVSTTGTKTGCMKWYIYAEDSNSYTMLLDHNTTAHQVWNSKDSAVTYENSDIKPVVDALVTAGWVVTPRLINLDELDPIADEKVEADDSGEINIAWLCDNIEGSVYGYWTSTGVNVSNYENHVYGLDEVCDVCVTPANIGSYGIRPVITVPKTIFE